MAELKPVIVRNLDLFKSHLIMFHVPSRLLYAIERKKYFSILRANNVRYLSDLQNLEIDCCQLDYNAEYVSDVTRTLSVSDLEEVSYSIPAHTTTIIYITNKTF